MQLSGLQFLNNEGGEMVKGSSLRTQVRVLAIYVFENMPTIQANHSPHPQNRSHAYLL